MNPVKLGCSEPALGAALTQALGRGTVLDGALADHLAACLACRLEHVTFAGLSDHAGPAPRRGRAASRGALRGLRLGGR